MEGSDAREREAGEGPDAGKRAQREQRAGGRTGRGGVDSNETVAIEWDNGGQQAKHRGE